MNRTPGIGGLLRRWWWVLALIVVAVLPVAWYLGSPLFLDRTVDEAFPMSAGATIPEGMTQRQAEEEMAKAAGRMVPAADPMPTATVPRVLARGVFGDVDRAHRGQGTATVYRVGEERVLRFDPFEVTNGPDLYVYLSGHPAPRSREQLHEGGAVEVARLKGNIGAQNYTLAPDVDLARVRSVVIYCLRFHTVFSTAELAAP